MNRTRQHPLEIDWVSGALRPLTVPYGLIVGVRNALYDSRVLARRRLPIPVISVGNISWGGTGKTNLVRWIADQLIRSGKTVAILSRGYGRRVRRDRVVGPLDEVDPTEVGDEPAMLRSGLPGLWLGIGPDRASMGEEVLQRASVDAFVLDDGFQHRRLERDLDVVIVRGRPTRLERHLIPSGSLREPPRGLSRAHLIAVNWGSEDPRPGDLDAVGVGIAPRVDMAIRPGELLEMPARTSLSVEEMGHAGVILASGIGNPDSFRQSAIQMGLHPLECLVYPDHHWYTFEDLAEMTESLARHPGAFLCTTEKDWQRLRRWPIRARVVILSVKVEFLGEGEQNLLARLRGCF